MSLNSDKGRNYETHVAGIVRRKVGSGMRNAGSHANWHRRSDIYTELPIHLEAKHHENVRIKEWMEQAEAAKSFSQTAVVAFRIEEEDYACLKLTDLLDLFVQIADQKLEIDDLRSPVAVDHTQKTGAENRVETAKDPARVAKEAEDMAARARNAKVERGSAVCKNGHLVDAYGFCMQKDCKYRRGYKPPKAKKEGKK